MSRDDMTPQERFFYGAGQVNAKRLTGQQWVDTIEKVAVALMDAQVADNEFDYHRAATTTMRALGYTNQGDQT